MSWVLYDEAVNELGAVIEVNGDAVFSGSSATFSGFTFDSGDVLFHIRYDYLDPGISTQVRVVLSGASADAYGMDPPLVFMSYVDPSEVNTPRAVLVGSVGNFTEDFEFILRDPDLDNVGELYMHKDGGDAITNFSGVLTFYLWEGEPPIDCFWKDLLNAEQVCDGALT